MHRSGEAPLAKVSTVTRVGVRGWAENRVQRSREKEVFRLCRRQSYLLVNYSYEN